MEYVHDRPLSLQVYKTAAEFKAHRLNRTEQCRLNTERSHIARQERIFQKEFKTARTKLESRWSLHPTSARPRLASDGSLILPDCRVIARPATSNLSIRGRTRSRDDLWVCEEANPSVIDTCTGDESLHPEVTMTMNNEKDEDAIGEDMAHNYVTGHGKIIFAVAKKSGTSALADDVAPCQSTANEGEHSTADEREATVVCRVEGQRHRRKTILPKANCGDSLSQALSVPDTHPATNRDPACYQGEAPIETKTYGYAKTAKGTGGYPEEAENLDLDTDQPQKRGSSLEFSHTARSFDLLTANFMERPLQSRTENTEDLTPTKAKPEEQNEDEASAEASPDVGGTPRPSGKAGRLQSRVDRFLQQQSEFNKRFPLRRHQVTSLKFVRPDLLRAAQPFDPVQHPLATRKALIIAEVLDRLGLEQNETE